MTAFLVDTNVLSELSRSRPHPRMPEWIQSHRDIYLSVLTLGELRRGVHRLRARSSPRAQSLEDWVRGVETRYADRLLDVDRDVAISWGMLPATRRLPPIDSLLAATAIAHGLTVATRNVRDFADAGADVVNPFEFAG